MTPEEHSLLERIYKISEENNKILRGLRRSQRFASIMRVLYWVIIIGLSVGAYYFIQPYVDMALKFVGTGANSIDNIQSTINSLQGVLK